MPSTLQVHVQLGLFGGCAEIVGMHVVAAHNRVREDGTEVFVSEHLRWNRPGTSAGGRTPGPSAPRPGLEMEAVELLPGAFQLPLWPAAARDGDAQGGGASTEVRDGA